VQHTLRIGFVTSLAASMALILGTPAAAKTATSAATSPSGPSALAAAKG
jgi:hypothetical protein